MAEEWVEMRHLDIERTARVTREAFDTVWAEKGWTLAQPPGTPPAPTPGPPVQPNPVAPATPATQ